jgi:hypothetical protein
LTASTELLAGRSAHRYRATYYDWLQGRGAFADRRWFTDDPPDQEPLIPDPEVLSEADRQPDSDYMKQRRAWMEAEEQRAATDDRRQLDLTDVPKFGAEGSRRDLGDSLQVMAPGLLALLLSTGLCAALLMWRFATYDPGR